MLLVLSCSIPQEYLTALKRLYPKADFLVIEKQKNVYDTISAHPDIYFYKSLSKTLICSNKIDRKILNTLKRHDASIVKSSGFPIGKYPKTAILNACKVGKFVIHNQEITDFEIKKVEQINNSIFIHVLQGYARCSIVPVGNHSIITEDVGIADKVTQCGIDVLLVRKSDIMLPGEKNGFLGGSSGVDTEGNVVFIGDISMHPDYDKIKQFLMLKNIGYKYIKKLPLFDAGSIIFL